MWNQVLGFLVLIEFYGIYVNKMLMQKKQGIQTDQMARGKKDKKLFVTELVMKVATYSVVVVEVSSIILYRNSTLPWLQAMGLCIGFLGCLVFGLAVFTMKDSWRAGIPEKDEIQLKTNGIYRISRNPAFLGFNLVYVGLLITFFNWVLLFFTVFAMVMLHLQIVQEEKYLAKTFGNAYLAYRAKVRRYI